VRGAEGQESAQILDRALNWPGGWFGVACVECT
jgi:hypothetical protein